MWGDTIRPSGQLAADCVELETEPAERVRVDQPLLDPVETGVEGREPRPFVATRERAELRAEPGQVLPDVLQLGVVAGALLESREPVLERGDVGQRQPCDRLADRRPNGTDLGAHIVGASGGGQLLLRLVQPPQQRVVHDGRRRRDFVHGRAQGVELTAEGSSLLHARGELLDAPAQARVAGRPLGQLRDPRPQCLDVADDVLLRLGIRQPDGKLLQLVAYLVEAAADVHGRALEPALEGFEPCMRRLVGLGRGGCCNRVESGSQRLDLP